MPNRGIYPLLSRRTTHIADEAIADHILCKKHRCLMRLLPTQLLSSQGFHRIVFHLATTLILYVKSRSYTGAVNLQQPSVRGLVIAKSAEGT